MPTPAALLALSAVLVTTSHAALENRNCCADSNSPDACHEIPHSTLLYPVFCAADHHEELDYCGIEQGTCAGGIAQDCNIHCMHNHSDHCYFDNCVGGIGRDCDGVAVEVPIGITTLHLDLAPTQHLDDGKVVVRTGIGSILHDLCCREHSHGAFCDPANYPLDQTMNPFDMFFDNSCACLLEWRKATWDIMYGHTWDHEYDSAPHSSDLTPVPDVVRESYLPAGLFAGYLPYKSNWNITEVRSTVDLCAPPGTTLACPPEDANCRFFCLGFLCQTCAPDQEDCSDHERSLWKQDSRDHANAGDSDYCCSGEFSRVAVTSLGHGYGVCR